MDMVIEEFKLMGDVAVLTGCGQNWLKNLTSALAEAGATVIVAGPQKEDIEGAAAEAGHLEQKVIPILTNLTSSREVQSMVEQVVSQFGKIDILINDLNLEFGKPFLEVTEEEWHQVMDSNLTSTFLCCKAVGKYMVNQSAGRIVNIVSGLGEKVISNGAPYCASMGGMIQLTRTLALEWARKNIRVNAIAIGWMEYNTAEAQEDLIARYIPMRRRGRHGDIAPLVLFLASNASSYVNGHICIVDGGLMARG